MKLHPDYPIRTDRLALRPFVESDLEAVLDLESRDDVVRYLMWGPMDRSAADAHVKRRIGQAAIDAEVNGMVLAATIPPDDRVIGEFMLRVTDEANRQGEIGWTIHPDQQGHGYATEGAGEMLRLGFDELGLHRSWADADPRNGASLRIMEKLGMRFEAEHRDTLFVKDEWVGATIYAILEDDWRSRA